jgi:hypothetical protein
MLSSAGLRSGGGLVRASAASDESSYVNGQALAPSTAA